MRFLAVISGSFSLAVVLAAYFLNGSFCYVISAVLLVSGCCIALFLRNKKYFLILVLVSFSMSAGFFTFALNFDTTVKKAESVSGKDYRYNAEVLDFPKVEDDYIRVSVKIRNTDVKGLKAYIYDYSGKTSNLIPGMQLSFAASLENVSALDTENVDSLLSSGIYLKGQFNSVIYCLSASKYSTFKYLPQHAKKFVSETIGKAFSDSTAPFFKSLLLGDKTELYKSGTDYTVLSRAGLSHVVAVSGMHVSFVVGLFQTLFGKKRFSAVLCIAFLWFFVMLTGASPSSIRAGIMQTVLLMSCVLRRENDVFTSLSIALAVILLVNPYSAKSVSLQLSFGATLGICLFAQKINDVILGSVKNEAVKKIIKYPAGILANSIAVLIFTVPIAAISFGFISTISPIANIFALWAIPVCFIGAGFVVLLYLFSPEFGMFFAKILSLFNEYIFSVCRISASLPCSALYINDFSSVFMLATVYAVVAIILISNENEAVRLYFSCLCSILIFVLYSVFSYADCSSQSAVFTVLDIGQGQCICATAGDGTVIVDCGTSSLFENPAVTASDYLKENYIDNVDALVFTHLHEDHANGAVSLMKLADVSAVVLPDYRNSDNALFDAITKYAFENEIKVYIIVEDCCFSVGNLQLNLYPAGSEASDLNEACMIINIACNDFDMLITGDSPDDREIDFVSDYDLENVEAIIAGHHGSSGSCCDAFLDEISPDFALISVGNGNLYGHPSDAALKRLFSRNINVFRTDINGNITLFYND